MQVSRRYKYKSKQSGISLVEVVLALALFAVVAAVIVSLSLGGTTSLVRAAKHTEAAALAQEGLEAVRSIRDRAYNELRYSQSGVQQSGNVWDFLGQGTTETIGDFTRVITFNDVCRDAADDVVTCPGNYTDPHSKEVVVDVSWDIRPGTQNNVVHRAYLTNWEGTDWIQTDWIGGSGQTIWSQTDEYDSDDGNIDVGTAGEVSLAQASGGVCPASTWTFDVPGDYTYNPADIEVAGGVAQLVAGGGGGGSSHFIEVGQVSTDENWLTVNLTNTYTTPVVVAFHEQDNESNPVSVRVRNAGSTSFEVRLQHAGSPAANLTAETISYIVVEEGIATIGSTQIEAHTLSTNVVGSSGGGWNGVSQSYSNTYGAPPIVLHQVMSDNDQDWVTTFVRSQASDDQPPTATGFEIGLNRAEAGTTHGTETIGWIAIESDLEDMVGAVSFETDITSDSIRGNGTSATFNFDNTYSSEPIVIGSQQEMDGVNGGWLVANSVSTSQVDLFVDEDEFNDGERNHTTETAAYVAFSGVFADDLGGGPGGGAATNPDFDTDASGWTYNDWQENGNRVNGVHQGVGGNPNGYIDIVVDKRKNRTLSGYWEQPFTIADPNPPTATLDFDWLISQYNPSFVTSFELYAFVENSSGAPTLGQQVWSSGQITGTSSWASVPTINVAPSLTTAGTYYLKLALEVITTGGGGPATGQNAIGYDNVQLTWSTGGGYPTTRPTIEPVTSYTPATIDGWTGLTETATKNGGEIYYQLSDDNGTTWYYWDGGSWTAAGSGDYNTAAQIDPVIMQFPSTNQSILFRAFLESDGNQQVQLDELTIDCAVAQYEVGTVVTDDSWVTVNLTNTYTDPVVVASYYENANTLPASTRVRNVNPTSFEVRLHNPSGSSLSNDTISYLVIERGIWNIGSIDVEAGTHITSTVGSQANGWLSDQVSFVANFNANPVVLHQVMTDNDTDWISSFVTRDGSIGDPPDASGMDIALNGSEVTSTHGTETIGWVAFDGNAIGLAGPVAFETNVTSDTVAGHDNGCYIFNYQNTFGAPPISLVSQMQIDGGDGGWGVQCSNSATQIGVHNEEDQVGDAERGHTTEIFGFVSFANAFAQGSGGNGYVLAGEFQSSALDMGDASPVQVVEWDESIPVCLPVCTIQLQVRTAPDSGGSPGTWTSWYGATGAGTYFTDAAGARVPIAINGNQWVQYRAELAGDGVSTPTLEEVRIDYR